MRHAMSLIETAAASPGAVLLACAISICLQLCGAVPVGDDIYEIVDVGVPFLRLRIHSERGRELRNLFVVPGDDDRLSGMGRV